MHEYDMNLKERISHLSTKEKLLYFWDYYKIHLIVVFLSLALIGNIIYSIATKTEILSYGMMINSEALISSESISDDYLKYSNNLDAKKSITLDTSTKINLGAMDAASMTVQMKLMAVVSSNELDYIIAPKEIIEQYNKDGLFLSLEEILPPDLYDFHSDNFFTYNFTDIEEGYLGEHPIAINISESPKLQEWNAFGNEEPYIAFISNSLRPDGTVDFLRYLYTTD